MIRPHKFRERLALAIAVVQALIISFQSVPYSVYAANNRFANLILIYHENLSCESYFKNNLSNSIFFMEN